MRALSVAVALSLLAACDQPSAVQENLADQLRAAIARYDRALVDGDAAALDQFYADDFQRIGNDGAVHDKKHQLRLMTGEVDLLNGGGDDVSVTMLSADTALVTGRFAGRYRYQGTEANFAERYTSLWVRKDGQWRLRHEHASLVANPEAPQP